MAAHKMPDSGLNLVVANLTSRFGTTAGFRKKKQENIADMAPHFLAYRYWQAEGTIYFHLPGLNNN